MMRDFRWQRGRSDKLLAEEWGIAVSTAQHLAAEASKLVAAEVMDRDGVRADIGIALKKALDGSLAEGDWRAVAQVAKVFGETSGASAPTKIEAVVSDGAATPAAARTAMLEAFGRVTPPVAADDAAPGDADPNPPAAA